MTHASYFYLILVTSYSWGRTFSFRGKGKNTGIGRLGFCLPKNGQYVNYCLPLTFPFGLQLFSNTSDNNPVVSYIMVNSSDVVMDALLSSGT